MLKQTLTKWTEMDGNSTNGCASESERNVDGGVRGKR